jgi:RNA polymerase sigma-70 factor (ECF subfamily)
MASMLRVQRWFTGVRDSASGVDWEAVYRVELPRVYNFMRYMVRDHELAEDLTAATFERAWRKRARYTDEGKITSWLFSIAKNVARDHFRSRRSQEPLSDGEAATTAGPEAQVIERETADRLRALLAELPERRRALVALKFGAGLTNRQIAALGGMSESNVGTTLQRTITWLREHWEDQ